MPSSPRRSRPDVWLSKPIIPYVLADAPLNFPVLASAGVLFLQGTELTDLPAQMKQMDRPELAKIPIMLHLDLVAGLGRDDAALRYLKTIPRISGIITVHQHLAVAARRLGLLSIVRLFLHDSRAVERGLAVLAATKADAVELLPGVAAADVAEQFTGLGIPLIAGGLVKTAETVQRILHSGCRAVSSSNQQLWALNQLA